MQRIKEQAAMEILIEGKDEYATTIFHYLSKYVLTVYLFHFSVTNKIRDNKIHWLGIYFDRHNGLVIIFLEDNCLVKNSKSSHLILHKNILLRIEHKLQY